MSALALQSFGFGDQLVRVTDMSGSAWFVANDVCRALELTNPREAVSKLDEDERGVISTDTLGGVQQVTIISESGVYSLIFKSRKPCAVAFRKWVTSEVLPTLRRTGHFEIDGANDDDAGSASVAVPRLGTRDDRDALRVAVLMVREMKDLYGQKAGRQMWVKLGFPVPDIDLAPAPPAPDEPKPAPEGDFHLWCVAVGVKASKTEATHQREFFDSYLAWCSRSGTTPMDAERFARMAKMLFGVEEHPEMVRAVICRKSGMTR